MLETVIRQDNGIIIRGVVAPQKELTAAWRLAYYPPGAQMKMHNHDVAQFSTLLSGQMRETAKRGEFDSSFLLMEYKPAGFSHANTFGPDGALLLSINFNPDGPDIDDYSPPVEWVLKSGADMRREWALLARNIARGARADAVEMESLTFDLLSALAGANEKQEKPAPHWLQRAREALAEGTESLEKIASDAGVHRVHLSRTFRRHFGRSITDFRREIRLARAIRFLARDGEAAGTASSAAGFCDQSHLTRVMRRELGVTPAAVKALFGA